MADASSNARLPDYKNPPVVETVLGVQFDRLPNAKNAHFGAFWETLGAGEWPTVADAPLLPTQFERFEATSGWAKGVQLQLTQDPACRLQIRNAGGNRMIQIQNTRLHFNWLGRGEQAYPRYDRVLREFISVLEQFRQFATDKSLGELRFNQWEVTYVNEIPRGTVWTTPADWGFFRLLGSAQPVERDIEGESFGGEWHFVIPQRRGRLHIQWQHGKGARDAKQDEANDFIRLTLTARGPIAESGDEVQSIREGLDFGRATIVRSFRDLMSDGANRYWGLKHEDDD